MTLPNYIVRDGEMMAPPPVTLDVKSLHMFVVGADAGKLQALCDQELNLSPRVRYQPLGPFVVFYAADMTNVVASGSVDEIDIGVWVPVFACEKKSRGFVARRLLAYTPYLWVDSSPALVGGRLIFGFPKHMGSLQVPARSGGSSFTVDTWVMPRQGGKAEMKTVLEVTPDPAIGTVGVPAGTTRVREWIGALEHTYGKVKHLFEASVAAERFLATLPRVERGMLLSFLVRGHGLPQVFLKQVPSADRTGKAVYQAIVETTMRMLDVRQRPRLLHGARIRALHCVSHQMASRLGLVGGAYTATPPYYYEVTSLFTIKTAFSAEVRPGVVLWQAP